MKINIYCKKKDENVYVSYLVLKILYLTVSVVKYQLDFVPFSGKETKKCHHTGL